MQECDCRHPLDSWCRSIMSAESPRDTSFAAVFVKQNVSVRNDTTLSSFSTTAHTDKWILTKTLEKRGTSVRCEVICKCNREKKKVFVSCFKSPYRLVLILGSPRLPSLPWHTYMILSCLFAVSAMKRASVGTSGASLILLLLLGFYFQAKHRFSDIKFI